MRITIETALTTSPTASTMQTFYSRTAARSVLWPPRLTLALDQDARGMLQICASGIRSPTTYFPPRVWMCLRRTDSHLRDQTT